MPKVNNFQRTVVVVGFWLILLVMAIPFSNLTSRTQEIYALDLVMEAYEAGQVRAIITSGTEFLVSSNGAYIYAQSDGMYRVSDGEYLGAYPSAYFSPDGTHFVQRGVGMYRLADMALRLATAHPVKFSLDGEYFAVDTDGVYRLSDLTRVLHIPGATFAFSDEGHLVATSHGRVYHLTDLDRSIEVPGIREGVIPFMSPDGRFAWARNSTLISVDSGKVVSPTMNAVQFTLDGQWAVISEIGIFDLSSDTQTPAIALEGVESILVSPLGRYFATPKGVFRLFDGDQLIDTQHLILPEFKFAPDDTTVVIAGDGLYQLEPPEILHNLQSFGNYHANGRYVSTDDRIVRATDGSIIFALEGKRLPSLKISPDGSLVAFDSDGVFRLETGERLFSIAGFPDAFSVDANYLTIRGRDETAIYRTIDGRRYEGLEPLYTEFGLLNVGQVVFVVDSTEQQSQLPFIRVTPEQQFSRGDNASFRSLPFISSGMYLSVLETAPGLVRVDYGDYSLWTKVSPDNILWLPG